MEQPEAGEGRSSTAGTGTRPEQHLGAAARRHVRERGSGEARIWGLGENFGAETTQIDTERTFGPGSSHEPGPKTLWSRLVTPTGTKGLSGTRNIAREAQRAFGPGWC